MNKTEKYISISVFAIVLLATIWTLIPEKVKADAYLSIQHFYGDTYTHADLITSKGVTYSNTIVDLSTPTTTATNWAQSTGTGWSFGMGSSNARDGSSNAIQVTTDASVGDIATYTFSANQDLSQTYFLGAWVKSATTESAAVFKVILRDSNSTLIAGCSTTYSMPAFTTQVWKWVEWDISACRGRGLFRKFAIKGDTGVAATILNISGLKAYSVSNGYGPAIGSVVDSAISSGTVTRGEFACYEGIGSATFTGGVATCGADAENVAGVALDTVTHASKNKVRLQTTGVIVRPTAGAVTDDAAVTVQSGGVNVDDDGEAASIVGYATESAAATGANIYVRLHL